MSKNIQMLLIAVMGVCSPSAWAVSQIQETWSSYTGNGFLNWELNGATAFDKGRSRSDSEEHRLFHTTPVHFVHIDRLDLDKRWVIDPKHKRYTEESISEAIARLKQEIEKAEQDWDKEQKKEKPQKAQEPDYRIKSVKTTTQGPGAAVMLNGFSCRPYSVKTVIEYESVKDHSAAGSQTLYTKFWTTDSAALAQYQKDAMAFWQASSKELTDSLRKTQFLKAMQDAVAKSPQNAQENPWFAHLTSGAKHYDNAVRTVFVYTLGHLKGNEPAAKPEPASDKESLVQPGDLSGGVGGLVGGIASRWASKKVEQKVEAKMAEHPAWVDDITKDLDGETVGWGYASEIKSVTNSAPADLFEIPAGYKKVKSL